MNQTTINRINQLHPKIKDEVKKLVEKANAQLTGNAEMVITQGLRTIAEQDALYAQGRTKPGKIVTNAKGGSSYHNYGLAIDFTLIIDGKNVVWDTQKDFDKDNIADWLEVVKVFTDAGYEWGGNFKTFKDYPHFQKTFGYATSQLKKMFDAGKKNKDGYVII
jgi:peptidoglycan L-alanyl-D-glutamate endopeptidase CwlK